MYESRKKVWTLKKRANGTETWMWTCDVCDCTSLEQFKLCLTCMKGRRPERTEDNSREIKVAVPTDKLY